MSNTLRITVTPHHGEAVEFHSTGLHEDYSYTVNDYTGELIVERIVYGPRGTDEWARASTTVVAAWPDAQWQSVLLTSPRFG